MYSEIFLILLRSVDFLGGFYVNLISIILFHHYGTITKNYFNKNCIFKFLYLSIININFDLDNPHFSKRRFEKKCYYYYFIYFEMRNINIGL